LKRGVIYTVLSCLVAILMIFTSCSASSSSTSTTIQLSTTSVASTALKTTPTANSSTTTTNTSITPTGNWWDKLGKPQYGGAMVLRLNKDISSFDPYSTSSLMSIESGWMEKLVTDDWTLDPSIFSYKLQFRPNDYDKGLLAKSWEFTDPSTIVYHLHQGIHWQNVSPVNGREFIADDVVFHYDRLYGLGDGFTKPSPYHTTDPEIGTLISISAIDKYTVAFKWNVPNPEYINEALEATNTSTDIEAPEAINQWGNLNDWHHAIGTGPFILTDFVSGGSATLVKNTNYWGYDERYPQNQLPYADSVNYLIIPDDSTALAGLRTGKIDAMDGISLETAQSMQKTNPEILQITIPQIANSIDPRNDVAPFNDVRVRQAMQMSIDLPTIAKTYYGGSADPWPSTLTSNYMSGWGFPYNLWPQDLKDQYAYNPTAAKQLLASAGYPNGFKTDIVAASDTDMNLLQIVKSYFSGVGIEMDIRTMDYASWTAFVQVSRKQDQLAERGSGSLGEAYEPLRQLTRFRTGYTVNWGMINDPVFNAFYTSAMGANSLDAIKKIVSDANKYVAQQHFDISLLEPSLFTFFQPWFKGYSGQNSSIGGSLSTPLLFGFYASRFWVDNNLKKSLGR
jgi:peptide/nickel transport system substrate-binding protein